MKAVIPGSFDPVTFGHIDIISRTGRLFSELHILVGTTPKKVGFFSPEEKVAMIQESISHLPIAEKTKVISWSGLTVDYCQKNEILFIVRGVRSSSDFEFEVNMSEINRSLKPEIETIMIPSHPGQRWISSSAVREIASVGGDISKFVPDKIKEKVLQKLRSLK